MEINDPFGGLSSGHGGEATRLTIGGSQGQSGTLNIKILEQTDYLMSNPESSLVVGTNGGEGTFVLDGRAITDQSKNVGYTFKRVTAGTGVNGQQSVGTINLLGSGKNPYLYTPSYQALINASSLSIGSDGGSGVLNVDGATLDVASVYPNYEFTDNVFVLGSGANSTGVVNVLGGGKISVTYPLANLDQQPGLIGRDKGTGILNIAGQATGFDVDGVTPVTYSSRVSFYNGLIVGQDAGSKGYVNVTEGGLLRSFRETIIGRDGAEGHVLISGANSHFDVLGSDGSTYHDDYSDVPNGELTLGSQGGTGTLTIDDGAVVNIGNWRGDLSKESQINITGGTGALNLTDSVNSTGALILKGDEGKVGTLNASEINFGDGQGAIIFNHNDYSANYEFTYDLVGGGVDHSYVITQSGVTVLNRDNSKFAGQTNINGGVLEVNGILGGSLAVNNTGTLTGVGTVGNTVLNAGGTINIGHYKSTQPSVLTINGDYTGNGGTIVFDTVLGGDSSPTDKLVITGNMSNIVEKCTTIIV